MGAHSNPRNGPSNRKIKNIHIKDIENIYIKDICDMKSYTEYLQKHKCSLLLLL